MAIQAYYDKLAEGSEAWNAWRTACPDTKIDLSGAKISLPGQELRNFDFSGVDFSRAVFSDIVIRQANFTNAVFRGAEFQAEVILEDCDFQDAIFEDTSFEFCHLIKGRFHRSDRGVITGLSFLNGHCEKVAFSGTFRAIDFNKSELHEVDFTEVIFHDCSFSEATAIQCIFADTKLNDVPFEGARLIGSDFRRASFKSTTGPANTGDFKDLLAADLTGADFRGAQGYQFDDNRAQGIILSPYASDEWSVLRRAYTGAKFSFNITVLLIFFLPIIAKAVFWMQVAQFEHSIEQVESSLSKTADVLSVMPNPVLRSLGEKVREVGSRGSCLAGSCEPVWLPRILLGIPVPFRADHWPGYLLLGLTAAAAPMLILYNLSRAILTYFVLPLRDEEDRSGHTPRRLWSDKRQAIEHGSAEDLAGRLWIFTKIYRAITGFLLKIRTRYAWMMPLHMLVQRLQYVAYGLALIHISRVVGIFVSLPG